MSAQKLTTTGLVLRLVKLRESDQILTLLTPHHGIVSASARGSLRPNNKLFSASGLYSYSEWTLHPGKSMYSVEEATSINVFFGLRQSIDALGLAAYISELLQIYQPTGEEAASLLRLALNCLHVLSEGKRNPQLVKAVFELRSLCEIGFMPALLGCRECGRYEGGAFLFDVHSGGLLCDSCAESIDRTSNINSAVLAALRFIALSDEEKIFNFSLGAENLTLLCQLTENYALCHLDYAPKTLAFLKTLEM